MELQELCYTQKSPIRQKWRLGGFVFIIALESCHTFMCFIEATRSLNTERSDLFWT
jgi:hypothetical protein